MDEIEIKKCLKEIYFDLKEKGYNPLEQIVGYLISADPGYISSYNGCRDRILKLDRIKVLTIILGGFLDI